MTRVRSPQSVDGAGVGCGVGGAGLVLGLAFLVLHLPYLPASLEDLDSINFALGMRQFDVAHHQPHPPGYPVFIFAARIAHLASQPEARALGLLSLLAGALGVVAIVALFHRLGGDGGTLWTGLGAALAVASPLYWFTAVRPLSDAMGLTVAIAVQALTLGARTARATYVASFCAGVAAGIRSQAVWLTLPLLIVQTTRTTGQRSGSWKGAIAAYAAGVLVWLVPLIALSGGPVPYWRALFNQGAEDLGGVRMLSTTPTPRQLIDALYYAFVAPWAVWPAAIVVIALACAGAAALVRRDRRALRLALIAFGPYVLFDLLFQETVTLRYALPLVVPVAYLASQGLRLLPRHPAIEIAAAVVIFNAYVGGTSIAAYSRQKAPAFRLLADMVDTQATQPALPVAAMDRREDLDLRRPMTWLGEAAPRFQRRLPAPPQHEWLEPVNYWSRGGASPVWFVVDPLRTSIHLIQHDDPTAYRWTLPYPGLLSGVRPSEMDWYRVARPEWYVGEGWALTPEAAGVAEADRRGLSFGPIEGWVRKDVLGGAGVLVIGGRNFEPAVHSRLTVSTEFNGLKQAALADSNGILKEMTVAAGPFIEVMRLPSHDVRLAGGDYVHLLVTAMPAARLAIEQFDASATRPIIGFGGGWHEQEYNAATGRRWRWLGERGELLVGKSAGVTGPFTLRLEGESPLKYFSRGSRLVVRAGDRVLLDAILSADFSLTIPVADLTAGISLETDQTYVPAERAWRRTRDRRRLGLRIFRCELRSVRN